MKKKTILLAATLLLSVPMLVVAQNDKAGEEAAVARVVQYYFDAVRNDDAGTLKKAFHPKAKSFNAKDNGDLWEISQQRVGAMLQSNARRHMPKPNATMKIVALDVTGRAASVKTETEYFTMGDPKILSQLAYKGGKITEYLSLVKFDDGWKIVSRIFSFEPIRAIAQVQDVRH